MPETALSILCGTWNLDYEDELQLIFYKNGTGEIIMRRIFTAWIAAETKWKLLGPKSLDQIFINSDTGDSLEAQVVAQFDMEITITKHVITTRGSTDGLTLNEEYLIDNAFLPKSYSVRLEKGSFKTLFERRTGPEIPWTPSYRYQLVFDKSPYPSLDEWKDPEEAPEPSFLGFSEWKEFCSRKIPRAAEQT